MKNIIVVFALLVLAAPTQAQLLRKIKDKVNKSIDKAVGLDDPESSSSSSSSSASKETQKWCDTVDGLASIYSSQGRLDIVYSESSIGLGSDKKGYRLILSEQVDGKTQFVVVENGKVIATGSRVKNEWVGQGVSNGFSVGNPGEGRDKEMAKYIIADSVKHNMPKTEAKTATIQKVNEDQMDMAISMAKQTDEYKKMSAEEKKEFEETMKKAMAQNNARAGETISIAAQQGGSFSTVSGYRLVVKGKTYGKFMYPPVVEVSDDGTNVFAVGIDEKAKPVLVVNGKKTMLDENRFTGMSGKIVRSSDLRKFVYVEQKKMSEEEIQSFYSVEGKKISYNVLRADGSSSLVTDYTNAGKFLLTNSGNIINVNQQTAEVYVDGKKAGKFEVRDGYSFDTDAMLVGDDVSKIAYYDGVEGSINYLDGRVEKLGILYPTVISENGKNYLTWFRKCKNQIFIVKHAF
jgi:hypothetical protein